MDQSIDRVNVVVIESGGCHMTTHCDLDTATTLIALISEDPASWAEAMSVWPRYRTPAVCEFVSSIPLEECGCDSVMESLLTTNAWVAIDFREQRILTGGQFMPVGRDASFAMVVDESGKQRCPMSIHLPPWWELREGVEPRELRQGRHSTGHKPHVDRDVLYGDAFLADVATRVLETTGSERWRQSGASENRQALYPFTVSVHRYWLMTPRDDLDGRMPRELLHGAMDWSDAVIWGQRLRFEDGAPMVAAPCDWSGFETAPMGREEMCFYFDLCREIINAGWFYLTQPSEPSGHPGQSQDSDGSTRPVQMAEFISYLRGVRDNWLDNPFEGDSPPRFIIECCRRRVPRGEGVPVEGIDGAQSEQHVAECDCPICDMMADGIFGVGFTGIDGHHLELDDEFAFSMQPTREAWEAQQQENAQFHAQLDRELAERKSAGETEDPFASAWSGVSDDAPLPGDSGGFLKTVFMIAEIVSDLETSGASRDDIRSLNNCFAKFRRSDSGDRALSASELMARLESLSDRYPQLISKSADLQSRINESLRGDRTCSDDSDVPL